MQLAGFTDFSDLLRPGVYALVLRGVVVYVGKSKCPLARIASHRSLAGRASPSWLPIKGVQFDGFFVRPCSPDKIDALEREMVNLYKPRKNQQLKTAEPIRAEVVLQIGGNVVMLNQQDVPVRRRAL